jgi:2-desacetyl-2-hydroxyethyl bacteriochlorophyllide A dehydrogenase
VGIDNKRKCIYNQIKGEITMPTNPTIVFCAPKVVEIEDRPMPQPAAGQLLIKTTRTLISIGTELTILSGEYPAGSYWASYGKLPFDPGYDNIGTVVEVGADVAKEWIGKNVGTYGNHALYTLSDPQTVRPVIRDIPDEQAAFFTIAEIVMNGVRRAKVTWGEAVVVYGLGLLGQLTVQFCRLAGAGPIFAVDVTDSRLARLPKHSSIVPVNAAKEEVKTVVEKQTRGRMAEVVFEVTGAHDLIPKQFETLHKQGRFVVLSSPRGKTSFDFHDLCNAPSYTIIGVHNMSHPPVATLDYPWTMHRHAELFFDLVADGVLAIEPLISHRERYCEARRLYEMLLRDRSDAMGIVLDWTL